MHARLILDHDDMDGQLEELITSFKLGDWEIARSAFAGFERRLENHLTFEEEMLFPNFARELARETDDLIDEHRAIRKRVDELAVGIEVHQTRLAAIEELAALLRRHAARESKLLYRWADTHQSFTFENTTEPHSTVPERS